jgi:uridine kinase
MFNQYKGWYLLLIFFIKLFFLGYFSSGYQTDLFFPFTNWFINNKGDPWAAIVDNSISAEFPYSTLMLYILAFFNYLIDIFNIESYFFKNLVYSLPLLFSDFLILFCLIKLTQYNKVRVLYLYALSPIILFSTYIHHQLDVIPISLFLLSLLFFVKRQYAISALIYGAALSTKLNILLALPLLIIYLYKHREWRSVIFFPIISISFFFFIAFPYLSSDAYISLVLFNAKQKILFDSNFIIGDVKIYFPIFISLILYAFFLSFNKVNKDLLATFISILFIANIFFVTPSPGWYVWLLPFITLSIAKNDKKIIEGYLALIVLNICYLVYFVFAHKYDYAPILAYGKEVFLYHLEGGVITSVVFTFLESALICTVLYVYKYSVKSNDLYKRKTPFLIGVGGDSGTGKSTLKLLIADLFKENLLQIEGDGDHRWERGSENWNSHTHLNPKANWLHRQSENLIELKSWKDAKRVDYDHNTGEFTEQYFIRPKEFILISGLHPFYLPISRKAIDLKIYMEPAEELRRYWKIQRDMSHRGYTLDKIMSQIESRMTDARKYIYPQKMFSDLIISFFPLSVISDYNKANDINVGLRVTCEASIHFEEILACLNIETNWDYSEDLNSQVIELYSAPNQVDFNELSNKFIPNVDELVYEANFDSGYNGFIQLVILLSISQKMRGDN